MNRSALCLVLLVGACATSAAALRSDADRDNPRAKDDALALFVHGRDLDPIDLPVLGQGPPYGQVTGTPIGDKGLLAVPSATAAAPALGFLESSCASGDSCGCDVGAEYHAWSNGTRVVIARLIPDIEVHTIKHEGTCGEGCGVEAPPPTTMIISLGTMDPSQVDVVDVHYHYDQVVETCDHPMPRP